MPVAPAVAETWIRAQLTADPALSGVEVVTAPVPEDINPPYIVISMLSSRSIQYLAGPVAWGELVYLVHGTAESGTYSGWLNTVAARIHADLHDQRGTAAGGTVIECREIGDHRLPEPPDGGRQLLQAGARFRIQAKA